jgi:hypothetical protein
MVHVINQKQNIIKHERLVYGQILIVIDENYIGDHNLAQLHLNQTQI